MHLIRREDLVAFLEAVGEASRSGWRLYLVGSTSQLAEGWIPSVRRLTMADAGTDGAGGLSAALEVASRRAGVPLLCESPADVVPLPPGATDRARSVAASVLQHRRLELLHYDPYSVSLRLLARGDEEDYQTVLAYLRHEWIDIATMDELVREVLPHFTRDVIAQDPAEFRRKYRGLHQMWRAERS